MRGAVFPRPPARLDSEATVQALGRLGKVAEDSRIGVDELRARTDLLEGVVAYGNTSMDRNEWIVISDANDGRYLPFSLQVGPMKGVQLVTRGQIGVGYRLLSKGVWRVDALVEVWDTSFTGGDWADLDVVVFRPDGTEYERKRFNVRAIAEARVSLGGPHSFVVPDPGYEVFCMGRSGKWRRFMGGTLWSTFSVNKWDNGVTAQPPGTVPDGQAPE